MLSRIKITIVEDHPILIYGLTNLINNQEDMEITGEAFSFTDAVKLISTTEPDVALIDIKLAGKETGIDLIKYITANHAKTRSIILTNYDDPLYVGMALRNGARGFLTKTEPNENIIDAIRKVASGGNYLKLNSKPNPLTESLDLCLTPIETLSEREIQIVELTGYGCTSSEISSRLNLSINTVKAHKKNIITKLHLRNTNDLLKSSIQWLMTQR